MRHLILLLCVAVVAPVRADVTPRFVDARGAWSLLAKEATVLDARPAAAYRKGHLAGARSVAWDTFSDRSSPLAKGKLNPEDSALAQLLGELGVRRDRPVLVYGDPPSGWGEEGRIAWMLETLGHADVHVLDGGVNAWTAAGGTLSREAPPSATGLFEVRRIDGTSASADEVSAAIGATATTILDTRTAEEYRGATWYGAPRGGHIPRARLFPWGSLLDASGKLLPAGRIREMVGANGPVIAYCTGGVRSGFVYWALCHAGVPHVRNFPGSWWEWSGRTDLPVETQGK